MTSRPGDSEAGGRGGAGPDLASIPALPARYRPVRWLGRGGCAEVVLVEDAAEPKVPKAIKILLSDLPPAVVAGFRDEFRLLTTLEHPGLARVFEFGELPGGRAYYTGEYVPGQDLGAVERTPREVCLALAAVCRALGYVHARGYVHNDVKPANVLVASDPAGARLLDFGLAGVDHGRSRTIAGTPGYIAPERLAGDPWDVRADLYAVGATLYRVLAGRRVVKHEDPVEALARLRKGWTPLSEARPDLPPALAALGRDLLALDPGARPRTAAEVVARLGDAIGERLPLETPGTARCYALASTLVGRRDEIDFVERAMASALAGPAPRLCAIGGSPGSGKSRLLREVRARAETAGWRVAETVCREGDGAADPILRLLALLGPQGAGAPGADGGSDALAAALHAGAAGRRTLVFVDDAHRGADLVWRIAFAFARRAASAGSPLVALLAFDGGDLPAAAIRWLALGLSEGACVRRDVGPLDRADLRAMLASLFGEGVIPDDRQDSIARRSGGSPLLVEEIVREMVETGVLYSDPGGWRVSDPPSDSGSRPISSSSGRLEDFLRRRCADLPRDAAAVLVALASLGGPAPARALGDVVGPETDVRLGLAQLGDRSLVALDGETAMLSHEALGALVMDAMPAGLRQARYQVAARWLAASGADDIRLARAFHDAGEPALAVEHGLRGGRSARAAGEGRLCIRCLEPVRQDARIAGTEPERRAEIERLLGEAYEMVGRFADAEAALAAAFDLLPAGARPQRVRLAAPAVRSALLAGDFAAADAWLERAAANAAEGDPIEDALVSYGRARIALFRNQGRVARDQVRGLLARTEGLGGREIDLLRASALVTACGVELRFDVQGALGLARQALAAAERVGDRSLVVTAASNVGSCASSAGQPQEAERAIDRAIDECERTGDLAFLSIQLCALAEAQHLRGAWSEARASVARARAFEASGSVVTPSSTSTALLAWAEGDYDTAAREARRALERPALWQHGALMAAVASAASLDRPDPDLAALAARAEAEAIRAGTPLDEAHAGLVRAYTLGATDARGGGEALAHAADALEALGYREESLTAILVDAARLLGRAGAADRAAACLARARALLAACGSRPGVRRVDEIASLLRRTAARARPGRAPRAALSAPGPGSVPVDEPGPAPPTLVTAPSIRVPVSALSAADSRFIELTLGPVELKHGFAEVVGRSPAMTRALGLLDRLAESEAPVLLLGETGTGKEVFARALHGAGPRAAGPFVAVNCAAIPATLFEAELFGHKRGAFTGAVRDHAGLAQQAHLGTLLLDEVGDLPLEIQPKLLRVLEERRVRPVGGDRELPVDVRVVSATNRDLGALVEKGRFRGDLYFRLNVVEVRLPPLRERLADLPELARHLLGRHGRGDQTLSPGTLKALTSYSWPGNVRELENEILRASVLAGTGVIHMRHLSQKVVKSTSRSTPIGGSGTLAERMQAVEREIVRETLRRTGGSRTLATRELGLTRQGLRLKLIRLGLQSPRRNRP